jgi:putative DNA primase/helicase
MMPNTNENPGAFGDATGAKIEIEAAKLQEQKYPATENDASDFADHDPDLAMAKRFLTALDSTATSFTFQTFDDNADLKRKSLARVFHGSLDQHAGSLIALQRKGAGVFVTVNETDLKGRKAENITRVRAFFLDLDGAPLDPVTAWEPPHIVCETSPGRSHAFWLVDDCPLHAFRQVQKDLIEPFGGDDCIHDLPRVMRLPGFYHQKGDPHMVRMIETGAFPAPFKVAEFGLNLERMKPARKLSERATPSGALPIDKGTTEATTDEVAELLSYIPADCCYADWLVTLMGLHDKYAGSSVGFDIADRWSAKGSKYVPGEVAQKWAGFEVGKGTSWPTVPALARANGADLGAIGRKYKSQRTMPARGQHNDALGQEAAPDAPEPRSFEELLEAAKALEPGQIDEMEAIVFESARLNPMRRDAIFRAIKGATKVPLGTLKDQLSHGTDTPDPDHLDLARMTLDEIGRENVICTDAFVWRWQDLGVWTQQDDRAIKQAVQSRLDGEPLIDVTANLVNGVTDVLKSDIYRPEHKFNLGNPETVNCLSGEIELHSDKWMLLPHCREHYRTTQIPVEHNPRADAPLFRAFLAQVFRDDPDRDDKTRAVLELMGYTLMSHARHEKFVMLIGPGANGKSVLLAVLEGLLGPENVAGVQPANFDRSFQRAHLHQKLANIVTELKQGEVIADAELKAITSGEPSTVEHKFKDPFVMRPFATCWFGTNHMPHTRDFSEALFRRATILQFNRTFAPQEQDPMLKNKLLAELPGILNITLDAYACALVDGFTQPESSNDAKKEWRLEADQVAQFVDDACQRDPESRTPAGDVFRAYQSWAQDNGIGKTVSAKGLRDRLTRLGFGAQKSGPTRYVTGLRALTTWGA